MKLGSAAHQPAVCSMFALGNIIMTEPSALVVLEPHHELLDFQFLSVNGP